ncbi:MAG: FMN-binding protein [Armatimonadota bacterium]|nr:FMN-binding protein [Armatimonadota bacterium]
MRKTVVLIALMVLTAMFASAGYAEVYLTREKAIKLALPISKEIVEEKLTLNKEQQERVRKKIGRKLKQEEYIFIVGKTDGKVDGYAIICNEIGKEMPITFIVGIKPDGKVRDVAIMVFRESRGSEVKDKRFLTQYRNKKSSDQIAINKDIRHVTGATLSCIAVSNGVKKALAVWEEFYGK